MNPKPCGIVVNSTGLGPFLTSSSIILLLDEILACSNNIPTEALHINPIHVDITYIKTTQPIDMIPVEEGDVSKTPFIKNIPLPIPKSLIQRTIATHQVCKLFELFLKIFNFSSVPFSIITY